MCIEVSGVADSRDQTDSLVYDSQMKATCEEWPARHIAPSNHVDDDIHSIYSTKDYLVNNELAEVCRQQDLVEMEILKMKLQLAETELATFRDFSKLAYTLNGSRSEFGAGQKSGLYKRRNDEVKHPQSWPHLLRRIPV